jgi:hypothetical protein
MSLFKDFDLQMFESLLKALEARAIRVLIFELVSPSVVILLPRLTYVWYIFYFLFIYFTVQGI